MEKVRKELVGKVVSDKNNKTITVLVETYKKHPLYGKRVKYSKKYAVHDEPKKATARDIGSIAATSPLPAPQSFSIKWMFFVSFN